jgi:hypothetical protein
MGQDNAGMMPGAMSSSGSGDMNENNILDMAVDILAKKIANKINMTQGTSEIQESQKSFNTMVGNMAAPTVSQ